MKSFRDLNIWKVGMKLSGSVYSATKTFPAEEKFGLSSQIRRAVVSIPSNIAEGWGRKGDKEFSRFLGIALGSIYEVQTQIELSNALGFLGRNEKTDLLETSEKLKAGVLKLITNLRVRGS